MNTLLCRCLKVAIIRFISILGGTITSISSNDNLNNYNRYGRFVCDSNPIAQTLTGIPTGYVAGGFVLFVLPGSQAYNGFRIQVLVSYKAEYIAIRAYQSDTWERWRQIYTTVIE